MWIILWVPCQCCLNQVQRDSIFKTCQLLKYKHIKMRFINLMLHIHLSKIEYKPYRLHFWIIKGSLIRLIFVKYPYPKSVFIYGHPVVRKALSWMKRCARRMNRRKWFAWVSLLHKSGYTNLDSWLSTR